MRVWIVGGCTCLLAVASINPGCQRTAAKPTEPAQVAVETRRAPFWQRWKNRRSTVRRTPVATRSTQRWRRSHVVRTAYANRPKAEVTYHGGLVASAPAPEAPLARARPVHRSLVDVPVTDVQGVAMRPLPPVAVPSTPRPVAEAVARRPQMRPVAPAPVAPRPAAPTVVRYESAPTVAARWEPVPPPPGMKAGTRVELEPELDLVAQTDRPVARVTSRRMPRIESDVIDNLWVRSDSTPQPKQVSYTPAVDTDGVILVP